MAPMVNSFKLEALTRVRERIAIYPPVGCGGIDRLLNFVAGWGATGLSMQILSDRQWPSNCLQSRADVAVPVGAIDGTSSL